MIRKYRYIGYARTHPRIWKAKNKITLLKKIRRETPVFAKGKRTDDFIEIKK